MPSTILYTYFVLWISDYSSRRVCNDTQPPHRPFLHYRNISAWSLPEMIAARQNVVEIACGYAVHTVLALPVAPQMFRWWPKIIETCFTSMVVIGETVCG